MLIRLMAFYRSRRSYGYRRRRAPVPFRRRPRRRVYRKKTAAPVVVPVEIPVEVPVEVPAGPSRWSRFKSAFPYYAKRAALAAVGGAIGGYAARKYGARMREMANLRKMRDTYAHGTYRLRRMANNWRYLRRISPSRTIDVSTLGDDGPGELKSPRYD